MVSSRWYTSYGEDRQRRGRIGDPDHDDGASVPDDSDRVLDRGRVADRLERNVGADTVGYLPNSIAQVTLARIDDEGRAEASCQLAPNRIGLRDDRLSRAA